VQTSNSGETSSWWYWSVRDEGGKVLRQYRSSALDPTQTALWIEDYVYRDGLLVGAERPPTLGGRRHFHLDHLDSPRLITSNDGQIVSFHDYPFGGETTSIYQETGAGFDREDPMKFTGHERDYAGGFGREVGGDAIDYMHARYYSPTAGQFLSVDPKLGSPGNPQSWNRYAYVGNNPINITDPTGQSWADVKAWVTQTAQSAAIYFGLALPSDGAVRREYIAKSSKVNGIRGQRNPARDALKDEARARSSKGGRAIAIEMDKRATGGLTPNSTNSGVNTAMDAAEKGGKVMFIIGVATTAYNVSTAPASERGRVAAQEAGGWTGAFIGGEIGGGVGAGIGGALGASAGGAPAIPGVAIGAVGGAFVGAGFGGNLGTEIAGDLYDRISNH
jgi:RHS repeat-associated protein